ncbi:MAG TPA: DUF1801 domain-containing protein [Candidatus Thermoplasmatota archaeon]|nr:DUF1801 domain-containing protein [Candidatus Thermoplasmatota archaeon]
MSTFQESRDALLRAVRAVFPDAKPAPRWAGVEAWAAPRPEGAVAHASTGTYDPKVTVVGIADRKGGPTIYFLDPGDYFVLDTHRALLEKAGLKVGRGCIYHTRKGPLPTDALETLFRIVKERDARAAAGAPAKEAAPRRMGGVDAPTTVDEYLARLPAPQRAALMRLRAQIRAAAPKATEKISYGMPTFVHEGNLVHMAAFRDHCSFFPGRAGVALALKDELEGFETAKGTIRFRPGKPLPAALVKKIVRMRVAENEARAAKRGTKKGAKKGAKKAAKRPAKKARRR